jgi:midasin (ATPase involved in ribosome maturation)
MAYEISLAEGSVLERLNCVLESGRIVLLIEKGGVHADITQINSVFMIEAKNDYQFLATMNSAGDFGDYRGDRENFKIFEIFRLESLKTAISTVIKSPL